MPFTALKHSTFSLALMVLAVSACGGGSPPARLVPLTGDSTNAHTLQPGDVVKVQVFGHDELSGEFPIDENDTLLLPIVGGFSVANMSVQDLRARIRREFGQLYTQSFVAVTPLFRVAVLGEVVHPGLYSVDPTMTVYTVLAQAGGTMRTANEKSMRLIRGGEQLAIPMDPTSLATATLRELGIRSGDQIIVPRKPVGYDTWLIGLQLLNVLLVAYTVFRK
ncbi:MAG TPA: polysaccharide biosynthesis/export family protein [Gemmatimonadales bacterium]|jgi:polysaccharide export outer membrane protein